jgi:thioredoxin 1
MKMNAPIIVAAGLALAGTGQADLIHLNNGRPFRGEVTGFADSAFVVKTAGGATTNLSADAVSGVDFERGHVNASIETKPTGSFTGKLWLFDKQTFHLEDAKGETQRIPLKNVARASFAFVPSPEKPRPVPARTTAPAPPPAARTPAGKPDIETIAHGERVNILRHLADGKVTVVDFYAQWCGPCRSIAPILEDIAKHDADVAVRKVDIVRWGSPVASQYDVDSIPRLQIYDRQGKLARTLAGFNENELRASIERAKAGR